VVANYFKDEKNVIGYEIINEPLSGSVFHSLMEMVWPNKGNNKNLLPIYKKVNE
jgi:aryl-phospho-beta-D-glucosidase BglC (GH1 family)